MKPLSPNARRLIEVKYVERLLTCGYGIGANSDPTILEICKFLEDAARAPAEEQGAAKDPS